MEPITPRIAVLGGTGGVGFALAGRWVAAGYTVLIGSRSLEKARGAVRELAPRVAAGGAARPMENSAAAVAGDIVVLAVPYANQRGILEEARGSLRGKILLSAVVPLMPPRVGTVQLPKAGSAAQEAQEILGEDVRVVAAFQNVAAQQLLAAGAPDCDVLVSGDREEDRARVISLVEAAGMRGYHAGKLANAAACEALTSVLLCINRRHKCHSGIRISGLPDTPD